jgi:tetratricopeptide (TPR) repeat protein
MLRVIREQEPTKPSTKLSTAEGLPTLAANRGSEPAKLTKLVRGELDWIVMKALEKDRNRRYETANGFAMDVQRYLAYEPVLACPPSAGYRLRKFTRRNKGTLTFIGLIFFFFVLLGSGIGWIARDRTARRALATESFDAALTQSRAFMKDENWPEAKAAAQRAKGLLSGAGGDETLQQNLEQVEADQAMVQKLELARLQQTEVKDEHYDVVRSDPAYAEAFRDYNLPVNELEPDEIARRVAASAIREQLLGALMDWARVQTNPVDRQKLGAVIRLADSDPWRRQLYEMLDRKDYAGLVRLSQEPQALGQPPVRLVALGNILARSDVQAAVNFLRRAQKRHPNDFWINHELAVQLVTLGPDYRHDALRYHTANVALRPLSPGAHYNLGLALHRKGQLDEAIAEFRETIRLKKDSAAAHGELGSALLDRGQLDEAIAECREAIRLNPNFAEAHCNLGTARSEMGQLDEAIAEFRAAILVKKDLAMAHNNLGNALREKGQLDEAIAEFWEAIRLKTGFALAHNNLGGALLDKGQLDEAIAECRAAILLQKDLAMAHNNLGSALRVKGRMDEAIAEAREAIRLNPIFAEAHCTLGTVLGDKGRRDEAIAEYREAIRLKKDYATAHYNLGNALHAKGRLDEAIAEYREAIRLKTDYALAHNNLGNALHAKGRLDEAIAEYREAIRLKKDYAMAHKNLGSALREKGQLDEAFAEIREAIRLKKDYAAAHYELGIALQEKGQLDEAIAECREAIRLNPNLAEAHCNLGIALHAKGRRDEAIAEYREAIRLKKAEPLFHNNLGNALLEKGKLDETITEFRESIRLNKANPLAHYNMGNALHAKGRLDEAISEFREAIRQNPDYAEAHCNLGDVLRKLGRFEESLTEFRLGHDLGSRKPGWRYPSEQWLRAAERLASLQKRLPKIIQGKDQPADAGERLTVAILCQLHKKLYANAACWYGKAFAAEPKLADDLRSGNRYNAACAAALAAAGKGSDAARLDEKVRVGLRKQALGWLRADLALWAAQRDSGEAESRAAARKALRHWQEDTDLASLRDPDAVAKLPPPERAACLKLWADVENTIARTNPAAPPTGKATKGP